MTDAANRDLLSSSRALASLISDATDLPPVSRSIHQIAEQSERMLATTAGGGAGAAGSAAPPPAATYRFLASQGVDAMDLDPSALQLARPAAAAGRSVWPSSVSGTVAVARSSRS